MNDDAFENKLQELTGAVQRPDPTPAWKADMLARARREADAAAEKSTRPPRWFMAALGVAWAAILLMNLATPRDPQPHTGRDYAAVKSLVAPEEMLHGDAWTLLALHNRMNPDLDLPR